jgi:hypothetical protein
MDQGLSRDERAALVAKKITLDERLRMVHGIGVVGRVQVRPGAPGFAGVAFQKVVDTCEHSEMRALRLRLPERVRQIPLRMADSWVGTFKRYCTSFEESNRSDRC